MTIIILITEMCPDPDLHSIQLTKKDSYFTEHSFVSTLNINGLIHCGHFIGN